MRFAENNRISHRQLFRQIILVFPAPFLLCLFKNGEMLGVNAMAGTILAAVLLSFYVIWLIRLAPAYGELSRMTGNITVRFIGLFFLLYVILSAAFLADLLAKVIPQSLISGISGKWMIRDVYAFLCVFSGVGLLPFGLEKVEKQGSARKPVILAFLTVCGIVLGMQVLLPAVFGKNRLLAETYPVLPLLDGADLPGNVLARFDVIWMGFLVFGLLFSLGSLFHYGNQIAEKTKLGSGRYWIPAAGWILSLYEKNGAGIEKYYGWYLAYIFVPLLLVIQIFLSVENKGRWKKKALSVSLFFFVSLMGTGCAAVEPEKRMYPLALGAGVSEEGFVLKYAMPDMNVTTGQEKPEEDPVSVLTLAGRNFQEIEEVYNRSQEKFLDLGHLQVVILDESMLTEENRKAFLEYLKQEEHVGEDVYMFRTGMLGEVFHWKGAEESSVGEYLQGIQENRTTGQQKKGVTLREAYHQFYQDGTLPWIPSVCVNGDLLEVDYGSAE